MAAVLMAKTCTRAVIQMALDKTTVTAAIGTLSDSGSDRLGTRSDGSADDQSNVSDDKGSDRLDRNDRDRRDNRDSHNDAHSNETSNVIDDDHNTN